MKIESYINFLKRDINRTLERIITYSDKKIYRALRYTILNTGKRLRPILMLVTFDALGGKINKDILKTATSIELIHNFSLIQDDLPCMDNDDFRRGRPTVHKVFGEDIAILTSDALLNEAYKIILDVDSFSPHLKIKIINEIILAVDRLISGQRRDLELVKNKGITPLELEDIYFHKTSALIIASVKIACLILDTKQDILNKLTSFAYKFGISFQIVDDILNITSNNKRFLGKRFTDRKKNKITYVSLCGLSNAKKRAEELILTAKKDIKNLKIKKEILFYLCDFILKRTY